jgi:hypothetical protein
MGLFSSLRDNVTEIGVLVITIVLVSILLLNLKDTTGVTAELNTTIDTAVTGIATPVDYVQIILLVLVFAAIIGILVFKFGRGKGNSDF